MDAIGAQGSSTQREVVQPGADSCHQSQRKIYFCGSIRGGREDADLYRNIITKLSYFGTVLTPFVGQQPDQEQLSDQAIYDRDMRLLGQADVLVAEVSVPSLGVGYEIGRAVAMNKKVLCLFRPDSGRVLSAMIRGLRSIGTEPVLVQDYEEKQLDHILHHFLGSIV